MPKLLYLKSAQSDFKDIFLYIRRESGSPTIARKFVQALQHKCEELARLPGKMGRARLELGSQIRSTPYRGYIIYFRYVGDIFEIINILEGHRDAEEHFREDH